MAREILHALIAKNRWSDCKLQLYESFNLYVSVSSKSRVLVPVMPTKTPFAELDTFSKRGNSYFILLPGGSEFETSGGAIVDGDDVGSMEMS